MRIAQVNLQPDYGGAERHTLLLADGLRLDGHDVTLCCHPRGRLITEAKERGLPADSVAARSQVDPRAALILAMRFRRLHPDVAHLQTSKDYLSGAIAAGIARVPIVVISRHMLLPVKPIMRRLFQRVDAVIALSGAVRDNLLRHDVPEAKLNLIYAGIDTAEFTRAVDESRGCHARGALGVPIGHLLVGTAGRMVEGKGHACLLNAIALLAQSGVPVTLLLIGEGPLRAELEQRARTLGIAGRVIFAGFHTDITALMAALDAFVMPSTCEEVLPLVLMEALAAGRPVVATSVGGVPEIIDHGRTGLLTPPGDPPALAEAIRRLAGDPSLRARISAAGHADVLQRFTLPRMIAETEQLYERLAMEKPQS